MSRGLKVNVSHLEFFLTASRTLNYTQAAKRLFTSRQNLTHGIKELERELGVELFTQEKGKLALTAEGEEAAGRTAVILNEIERLKTAFIPVESNEEPLCVVIMSNIFSFTPYDVSFVFDKAPQGRLRISELNCEECYEKVAAGRFDVALIACMDRDFPDCESITLHEDHLYILLSEDSPLASKRGLELSDLNGQKLQMPPGYEFQFDPLIRKFASRNYSIENIYPIATFNVVKKAVVEGDALGISSALFAGNPPEKTKVLPLLEEGTTVSLRVIYRRNSTKKKAIQNFIKDMSLGLPEDGESLV